MIDKTTVGVSAEPEEVEAVLHNLCGYHLHEPDPLFRYNALTREQVLYEALATAIRRERGRALAELTDRGQSLTQIAQSTNLATRQRVQRLIAVAKAADAAIAAAADAAVAEVQAASRDFEERLNAVEATLDEVVSGFIPVVTPEMLATPVEEEPTTGQIPVAPEPVVVRETMHESFDESVVNAFPQEDELGFFGEPTQALPALRPLLQPTREMTPSDENVPWWRRGRDNGAA